MFGFVIGTACLIGLATMLRRRHWRRWHGYGGPSCGHGGWHGGWHGPWQHGGPHHGPPGWGSGYGRWGRPSPVDWLVHRLEATPDQEKVIREQTETFFDRARGLGREFRDFRGDVARAMRGESFDETVMGELFARQDDRIKELREALMEALGKIHDVLDETQRRRLIGLLDRSYGGFGPFRM